MGQVDREVQERPRMIPTPVEEQLNYYAFKYVKNKEGQYEGGYFACSCKKTMDRLVKNWNSELDTFAFGSWVVEKSTDRVAPPLEEAKKKFAKFVGR